MTLLTLKTSKWMWIVWGCMIASWICPQNVLAEYRQVNWETLNLSAPQRNTLNSLDQQWKGEVSGTLPRIQSNEHRLKAAMRSSSPNEEEVMHLQRQIHEDKMRLKNHAWQIFLNKRRVLTPQQDQKLRQMMDLE